KVAKFLARVDIAEVHLDRRDSYGTDRIADGDRGVRIAAGVDNYPVRLAVSCLNPLADFAFPVGLPAFDRELQALALGFAHGLDVTQRLRAIGLGLADTQHV